MRECGEKREEGSGPSFGMDTHSGLDMDEDPAAESEKEASYPRESLAAVADAAKRSRRDED